MRETHDRRPGLLLVVEDDPDQAELMARAIRGASLAPQVVFRDSGGEALRFLGQEPPAGAEPGATPDLVLLDLKLGADSGIKVLQALRSRARTRLIPVVMLSMSADPGDIRESYASGANGYLVKPIAWRGFNEMLDATLRFWLGLNRPAPAA